MSDLLTVEITPPAHRGMTLAFSSAGQQFRENFSTQVYPFLDELIGAIRVLRTGFVDEKIKLHLGAPECELCIHAEENASNATLKIEMWPDSRRSRLSPPRTMLSVTGTRREIVEPFVSALKKLRASTTDADFEAGYGASFPQAQFDRLVSES